MAVTNSIAACRLQHYIGTYLYIYIQDINRNGNHNTSSDDSSNCCGLYNDLILFTKAGRIQHI